MQAPHEHASPIKSKKKGFFGKKIIRALFHDPRSSPPPGPVVIDRPAHSTPAVVPTPSSPYHQDIHEPVIVQEINNTDGGDGAGGIGSGGTIEAPGTS